MQRRPLKEIPIRKIASSPLSRQLVQRTPKQVHSEGTIVSPRSPNPGTTSVDSWTIFQDDDRIGSDVDNQSTEDKLDINSPEQLSDDGEEVEIVDENENPPVFPSFKSPMRRPPLLPYRLSSTPSLVGSSQSYSLEPALEDEEDGETPKYSNKRKTPFNTPQSASKAHGKRMLECEDEFDSPMSRMLTSASKKRRLLDS